MSKTHHQIHSLCRTMIPKTTRRQFIGTAGSSLLALLLGDQALAGTAEQGEFLFLEAEGFDNLGGWDGDQQSMDQMGSPYLLAHGLGTPVKDATTKAKFPSTGQYRIWVRTRDWVAPWNAPGTPGKFHVLLDGKPVKETFGTKNADWHWHDGGLVDIDKIDKEISIHDLTGFEGRCEAIIFCKDADFKPTNDIKKLTNFRRKLLGLPDKPAEGKSYDLVVCGGGFAGTSAALSAARQGLSVALVQDRPILGGNGSSEVRVWPEGHVNKAPYPHVGDIVNELYFNRKKQKEIYDRGHHSYNRRDSSYYDDEMKLDAVGAEPRIALFLEHRAIQTEMNGTKIASVVIQSTTTAKQTRIYGKLFSDCTGDAIVGHQAGADYEFAPIGMGSSNLWNVMDASDQEQVLKCECKDKDALTANYEEGKTAQPFPSCPWAIDLHDKPFPGRAKFHDKKTPKNYSNGTNSLDRLGNWFWESGFDRNQIEDIERIRDLNLRAMYGAWDALKNTDGLYPNHRIGWAAFIAGKRESRRLMGDVVLDAEDFRAQKKFEDGCYPCSWHIDLHMPNSQFDDGHKGDEFISDYTRGKKYKYSGIYWAPYRTLYSRNIENLFMAGRNISVTQTGLGPVRVMKTCGTMGEIVGKAASLCIKHKTTPKGVYQEHLNGLKELMKLPGKHRVS